MHNVPNLQLDINNKEANRLAEANKQDRNKKRVIESQIQDVQILEKIRVLAQEAALREQQKLTEVPVSRSSGAYSLVEAEVSQKRTEGVEDILSKASFTLDDFDEEDFINVMQNLFADDLPAQALWVGTFQNLGNDFLTQHAAAAVQEVKESSPVQSSGTAGVASKLSPPQSEAGSPTGRKPKSEDGTSKKADPAGKDKKSESETRQESHQQSESQQKQESEPKHGKKQESDQDHGKKQVSEQERSQEPEAANPDPGPTLESWLQWRRKLSAPEQEILDFLLDEAEYAIDNSYLNSEGRWISHKFIISIMPKVLRSMIICLNDGKISSNVVFSSARKMMQELCYLPFKKQKDKTLAVDVEDGLYKISKNPHHSFREWERDHKIAASLKLVPKGGRARRLEDEEKPSFS